MKPQPTIELSRQAIERRRKRYGRAFAEGVVTAATEVSPEVFHISLKQYVELLRAHAQFGGGMKIMKREVEFKSDGVAKNSRL